MQYWQPDVIHTHRSKENVLGALANRLSINVPCLRTSHGAPEHFPQGLHHLHKQLFAWLDIFCGRIPATTRNCCIRRSRRKTPPHICSQQNYCYRKTVSISTLSVLRLTLLIFAARTRAQSISVSLGVSSFSRRGGDSVGHRS